MGNLTWYEWKSGPVIACTNTPPFAALSVFLPLRSDLAPSKGGNKEALGVAWPSVDDEDR
jgi:hypothetical protein